MRQKKEELERQKKEELERQKKEELERQKKEELERQKKEELERWHLGATWASDERNTFLLCQFLSEKEREKSRVWKRRRNQRRNVKREVGQQKTSWESFRLKSKGPRFKLRKITPPPQSTILY